MATLYQELQSRIIRREIHFNLRLFVQENLTRSWWLALWLVLLTYVTVRLALSQIVADPIVTGIVLAVWLVTVAWTVVNEVTRQHSPVTYWLRNNLYSSITNIELTLVLVLVIIALLRGFFDWAVLRASFSTNPDVAAETLAQFDNPGANWGAVIDNIRNLMVFRFPRDQNWRLAAVGVIIIGLFIPTTIVYRGDKYRGKPIRRILTILWLLSPIAIYFLLRGFGGSDSPVPYLNPDQFWGGLLLTMIISVFAIVASFPLGVLMALGRRSQIRGIPAWLTFTLAGVITIWGLLTSTPQNLEAARNTFETVLSYWPLAVPLIAYLFQRYFDGNVLALFSTIYIEVVRGVPFITVLFMSVILFPILLPPGVEVLSTWRVLFASALFAAAYLAENVRGGLQSIPNGQYEAADSLGLSTYRKYRLVIMPQAIRVVIPAIVGQFIGLFKDTTLVAIVGLVDLLGAANLISAQPDWLGVRREPYVFIAFIYFIGSSVMAGYSRRLERNMGVGER
jgi:general L-amino acid transport system permease protein